MKNNKHSYKLKRVLVTWGLLFSVLFSFIILTTVQITTEGAIDGSTRRDLELQSVHIRENITWTDHVPSLARDFTVEYEGLDYVIADRNGKIIDGNLPEELEINKIPQERNPIVEVNTLNSHYYIHRGILRPKYEATNQANYNLYTIINSTEVETVYHRIRWIVLLVSLIVIAIMIFTLLVMSNRMTHTLQMITDDAARVTKTGDYSLPIRATGHLQEIDVLVDTCNHLLNQVNHTLERQKQFNSDVSHELRTPITVLKAQCQIARDQVDGNKEREHALNVIERHTNRMEWLIQTLLELSRIEQGRIPINDEIVNLSDVIYIICEDITILREQAWNSQKTLTSDTLDNTGLSSNLSVQDLFALSLEDIEIRANNELILTLLRNLIDNAVRYSSFSAPSPQGQNKLVEISLMKNESEIQIHIRDHGIGMNEEEVSHVFESFYRAERSRNKEGFGLGLPMADKIAHAYKGRIEVKSEPGKGSEFNVFIPVELITNA